MLFPSGLEERTKEFLDQHSHTIREWHKAHMESLSLEAKRTILVHESSKICADIQSSEGAYTDQQKSLTDLRRQLAEAQALVLSLQERLKTAQGVNPEDLIGHPLNMVRDKLTTTAEELPAIDRKIAELAGTMKALRGTYDVNTQQLIDFISQL